MREEKILLTAAQVLFMVLPLTGWATLYRQGKHSQNFSPLKFTSMLAAIAAFSLLVYMFYLQEAILFIALGSINLALRVTEWGYYLIVIVRRQDDRILRQENDDKVMYTVAFGTN